MTVSFMEQSQPNLGSLEPFYSYYKIVVYQFINRPFDIENL